MKNFTLHMGSQKIKVKWVDSLPDDILGEYDAEERVIRIVKGPEQWITYGHEWMHAFIRVNGYNEIIPDNLEEVICSAFGHAAETQFRDGLWKFEDDAS